MAAAKRNVAAMTFVLFCKEGEKATIFEKVYNPTPIDIKNIKFLSDSFFK